MALIQRQMPRRVFTHLKAGCRAFRQPPFITWGLCSRTTSPMALKLDKPSVSTVAVLARLRLAQRWMVRLRKSATAWVVYKSVFKSALRAC